MQTRRHARISPLLAVELRGGAPIAALLLALAGSALTGVVADAATDSAPGPAILQWFETGYPNVERKMPDFFMAGYGAVWFPPNRVAADPSSPGYDEFNKFSLGTPSNPTIYGTEQGFRSVMEQFHRANARVFLDLIANHCSGRNGSAGFIAAGGYPGFWMNPPGPKFAGSDWGDFNDGSKQSENPGGPNYDLFKGDLVGLIDIDLSGPGYNCSDGAWRHFFIRHPVDASNPENLPAGTVHNTPDPNNRRLYPDLDLPARTVVEPFSGRVFQLHPFNTESPLQGDPVAEDATGLLMRQSRWLMEEFGVDGFRLDAVKHIPNCFWNNFWDAAVHEGRIGPDGQRVSPFSFGEAVAGNDFILNNYIRKDAFAARDALDLNGAGQLRTLYDSGGFGSWQNVLSAHLDSQDDGFNNGTLGVNHVTSHDNGSNGNGGSAPAMPTGRSLGFTQHAYVLLRTGPAIVYHNSREMIDRFQSRGFWPREGQPLALGIDIDRVTPDDTITRLVQIRNSHARGQFFVRNADISDVLVFERASNGKGNLLVAVNDRYDTGFDQRTVVTSFPQGTRLHELTGNASDPDTDPFDDIADVLIVGPGGGVTIRVPRNASSTAGEHHKGYVAYGPVTPAGGLALTNVDTTIPGEPGSVVSYSRRLTPIDVISAESFDLVLTTAAGDPLDPSTDDFASFVINQGFVDFNGNGVIDEDDPGSEFYGHETFATVFEPLYNSGGTNGLYVQTINTDDLPEGMNYISAKAFRHRSAANNEQGGAPLYTDFRRVIYVDRVPPPMEAVSITTLCDLGLANITVGNPDFTANKVYAYLDLPEGEPVPPPGQSLPVIVQDRGRWRVAVNNLSKGLHTLMVVAVESPGGVDLSQSVTTIPFVIGADIDGDSELDPRDLYAFYELEGYSCEADLNSDGMVNAVDAALLSDLIRTTHGESAVEQ
ncbi:MAG: hypothetical protein ACTS3F_08790 [Phycisphaerales bacterium]